MSDLKKINWKSIFSFKSIAFTIIGVAFAVVGLQGFMVPNNFLDGGITGISILVKGFANVHISILLIVFNLPFLIIGYSKIGQTFSLKALIAVLLLAAGMYFIEIPIFTTDKVLIAVFGGFFIGMGIGFVIRGGGVIDGLEVIGYYTKKKSGFTSGEIILALNTIIILGAAFKFGIETAMYSILVYFTAMKTSDYVVDGFEEYTALTIISKEHEQIKSLIVNNFGKAISVYKGERGYLPENFHLKYECDIIMTIVTRLEIHRIKEAVNEIDAEAFFYIQSIKEVKGGLIKRKAEQH
ncbi:YitT family protein [Litoribacter ruber]|uniref:YitT family protein n=1 Tax=Litoribacter ruber TaxID=702568 RepID=A0AAP2G5S5_9BACT|nr:MULTISPECIES: YitT family protein [Litoribacter]MBS9525830.1 YitT family protein [Litoribacter alkaliphilus]MBT0810447.1 YitT family protein [Litoribacter ruber]